MLREGIIEGIIPTRIHVGCYITWQMGLSRIPLGVPRSVEDQAGPRAIPRKEGGAHEKYVVELREFTVSYLRQVKREIYAIHLEDT